MEYLVKIQDYLKLKIKDTYRVAIIGKEIAKKDSNSRMLFFFPRNAGTMPAKKLDSRFPTE